MADDKIAGRLPQEWGEYLNEHATRYGGQGVPVGALTTAGREAMAQALRDIQSEQEAKAQALRKVHSEPEAMAKALRDFHAQQEHTWKQLVEGRIHKAMYGSLKKAWGDRMVPLQSIRDLHHEEPDVGKPAPDQLAVHAEIGSTTDRERLLEGLTAEQRDAMEGVFPSEGLTVQALAERLDRPAEDVLRDLQSGALDVELPGLPGVPMKFSLGGGASGPDEIRDALDGADTPPDGKTPSRVDEVENTPEAGKPVATAGEPAATGQEPAAIGQEPAVIGQEPAAIGREPAVIGQEPARISHELAPSGPDPTRTVESTEHEVGGDLEDVATEIEDIDDVGDDLFEM